MQRAFFRRISGVHFADSISGLIVIKTGLRVLFVRERESVSPDLLDTLSTEHVEPDPAEKESSLGTAPALQSMGCEQDGVKSGSRIADREIDEETQCA